MTNKTASTRFDVQDYLENEDACVAYIQSAFEQAEHDPAFLCIALGDVARAAGMTNSERRRLINIESAKLPRLPVSLNGTP